MTSHPDHALPRPTDPEVGEDRTRPWILRSLTNGGQSRWLLALSAALLLTLLGSGAAAQGFAVDPLAVGADPRDVLVIDLDLDGRLDLAVANHGSGNVSVLRSAGAGLFAPAFSVPVAPSPVALTSLDCNDDGWPDLISASLGLELVSLARAKGDGSYFPALGFAAGGTPRDVAALDVDGDGSDDVLVAHADGVSWLRSLGTGWLDGPLSLAAGFDATSLVVADLDGVGGMDLLVADASHRQVRVLHDLSVGGASHQQTLPTLAGPQGLCLSDVNGDGLLDVLVANAGAAHLTLCLGLPGGAFAASQHVPTQVGPQAVQALDVTGDELVDLLVVGSSGLSLLTGDGTGGGGFNTSVLLSSSGAAWALTAGDLDGDFMPDLVAPSNVSDLALVHTNLWGPLIDLGQGTPGGPTLQGSGQPAAGDAMQFSVTGAQHGALLVAGLETLGLPLSGGVLVPAPLVLLALPEGASLDLHWPAGLLPGSSVYLQAQDGAGSLSNALRVLTQQH